MPAFQNDDLAFRSPSGDSADDTRSAFERTDARIKRALAGISTYSAAVDTSLTGLGTSIETVSSDLSAAEISLQGSIDVVAGNLLTYQNAFGTRFASSFASSIGTVFTTASDPGFVQVAALAAVAADFILVGVATKEPRWQTRVNFIKSTVGLEIPTTFATPTITVSDDYSFWLITRTALETVVGGDMYSSSTYMDARVNALRTVVLDLIAALKTAKVLV